MPPFCVSCRACEKSITEAPMSPCCLSCRACEKSITEAPICHHVVLVVVPVRRV